MVEQLSRGDSAGRRGDAASRCRPRSRDAGPYRGISGERENSSNCPMIAGASVCASRTRRSTVTSDELLRPNRRAKEKTRRPKVDYELAVDTQPSTELHLRGMTTDEVGDAIETFLSTAVMQGFAVVRIVHGKGTGALRDKTQEVLRGMPEVKSFRLGQVGRGRHRRDDRRTEVAERATDRPHGGVDHLDHPLRKERGDGTEREV